MNRCIPRYWTNKDVENLREAKKVELNEWNKEVLAKVSEEMTDVFSKGRTEEGLTCIIITMVIMRNYCLFWRSLHNYYYPYFTSV